MSTGETSHENMQEKMQQPRLPAKYSRELFTWRKNKVLELSSKGYSQSEIALELKVSKATISRDMVSIRQEFQRKKAALNEGLYHDYIMAMHGLNESLKTLWKIADKESTSDRDRMQAVGLIMQAYEQRVKFLDIGPIVDKIIANLKRERDDGGGEELQ